MSRFNEEQTKQINNAYIKLLDVTHRHRELQRTIEANFKELRRLNEEKENIESLLLQPYYDTDYFEDDDDDDDEFEDRK